MSYQSHPGQPGIEGAGAARQSPFDPSSRSDHGPANAALMAHQQEQRGVSELQSAVSAATGEAFGHANAAGVSPAPEAGTSTAGVNGSAAGQQQGGERQRGPVEFNHAISYVNKIKVRR